MLFIKGKNYLEEKCLKLRPGTVVWMIFSKGRKMMGTIILAYAANSKQGNLSALKGSDLRMLRNGLGMTKPNLNYPIVEGGVEF